MAAAKITARLEIEDWFVDTTRDSGKTVNVTLAGTKFTQQRVATSTTAAALPVGGVTTAGKLFVHNTDATDNISLSLISDGSTPFITLKPGEKNLLSLATTTLYTKASANTPVLAFCLTDA